ncbi:MAG TPA: hypothetical protein VG125_04995 [Pirellulales bacterium]|jgi:hypothetical protein|nr:hypothetical protein [Pirellulales bacterium]
MTTCRRFFVLAALAFWQGGFTFYSAVVVPAGEQVLGSSRQQGFVTRQVTNFLNAAGGAALPLCLWDLWIGARISGSRLRWAVWGGMSVTLSLQVWLHLVLDRLLQPDAMLIVDQQAFRAVHQWYLIASTAQWVCCLAFVALALRAWRKEDAASVASTPR